MTMKRLLHFLFLLFSPLFFPSGCTAQTNSGAYNAMLKALLQHNVPEVTVHEAAALRDSGAVFLDAREWREYEVSHIEGAVFVGYDHYKPEALTGIALDQTIVVYCSVGYRSEKITEKLRAAGYTRVSNLYGGIFEWVNQDQPVVKNADQATQEVHAYDRKWGVWLKKGKKVYR